MLSFATNGCLTNWHDVIALRNLFLDTAVQKLVFKKEHGIVVANRCFEQTLCVIGSRRIDHLQARRVDEIHLRIRGVKRTAVDTATRRPANDHWRGRIPEVVALRYE